MKTFSTQREMLEFFGIDNITMMYDTPLFTRLLDVGYNIIAIYEVQTSDAGWVIKGITKEKRVLTIDATGEVIEKTENLYPGNSAAIKSLKKKKLAHGNNMNVADLEQKERSAKNDEREAAAKERGVQALIKWTDAEIEKMNQRNMQSVAKALNKNAAASEIAALAATMLNNDCMIIVQAYSEPTVIEKDKIMTLARKAISELFKQYINKFKMEPSLIVKGNGNEKQKQQLTVDMFISKIKYKKLKPGPESNMSNEAQ